MFDLKTHVRPTLTIPFQVGFHADETGTVPKLTHTFRKPKGNKVGDLLERVTAAGANFEDKAERARATYLVIFAIWAELIVSVRGYGSLDEAPRDQVVRFFAGDELPEDATDEERDEYRAALEVHVDRSFWGLIDRFRFDPSFRDQAA